MATNLKEVKVKRTVFTKSTNPDEVRSYVTNCADTGSAATLFKNPHILTAFYTDGTAAAAAIQAALDAHALAPTTGNKNIIATKVVLGKIWLDSYANQVQVISNDDANRTSRLEAAANITLSFLTPQKLTATKKGIPEVPIVTIANVGTGNADARIINGVDYQPSQTTYILVEIAAGATISISQGQLRIKLTNKGEFIVMTAAQKGKFTHFTGLTAGTDYHLYAYSQNGKSQVSALSVAVPVTG